MKRFLIPLICLSIVLLFFFPILKGNVPFPGDLLVGNHEPYKSNSYEGFGPGAVPHKAQGPDVITQLYPWKYFVIESYKEGTMPFWNPYQFSGNPQFADFQSGAFYPGNLLFLLTTFLTGWTIYILLTPLLAMFFVYLYLREIGLSRIPSLFSGVVFAFSSYMVVWMEYGNIGHTLMWLPFILYVLEKLMKKYSLRWAIVFVLSFVMAFLAGYIQGYFYLTAVVVLYYFAKRMFTKTFSLKDTLYFLVLIGFPVALTLFQLLPTLQLFTHSSRGNYTLDQIQNLLNPFWYGITALVPDFFGHPASRNMWVPITYIERVSYFGFLPFILAIYGILTTWKERVVKLFTFIFLITFFLTLDLYVTKFLYLLPIPVISTTVPTRLLSLFVFSGSILAGFGFEKLLKREQIKKFIVVTFSAVAFIGTLWGVVLLSPRFIPDATWVLNMAVAKRNLYLPTFYVLSVVGICVLLFLKKWKTQTTKLILLGVIVLTLFDLFYFFHKITPFSPREYVFPQTPVMKYLKEHAGINRYWGYGNAAIGSNFTIVENQFSVEGLDALHLDKYTQLLESTTTGVPPKIVSRSDANLAPGFGTGDLSANTYRKKLMNILGIKYVLNKNDALANKQEADIATFHEDEYKLLWQEGPWQVYENKDVAPRFFLTDRYVVKSDSEFFKTFYDKSFDEHSTLILSQDPGLVRGSLLQKNVSLLSYSPTKVVLKTETDSPSLLFLSDVMYPGWKVYVDGTEKEIFQADYIFRSVVVPEGEHIVTFRYTSEPFMMGMMISLISVIILCFVLWKVKVKQV